MQSVERSAIPPAKLEVNNNRVTAPGERFGWRGVLLALGFYSLLTIIMTWPLILNFGNAVPLGDIEDRYQNFWNFWWVKWSVSHLHNPYQSTFLYHPYYTGFGPLSLGNSLPLHLHTLQLANSLLVLPLTVLAGVAAAYNGIIFGTFVASGLGAFLLARHFVKNTAAALVAGVVYAFSGIRFEAIHGSWTNILTTQWLPFYILALHLWHERRRWPYLAGAIVCLSACAYTDWYNTTYLLLYTLFFFIIAGWPRNWWRVVKTLFPVGFGALVVSSPLLIPAIFELKNPLFTTIYTIQKDYRDSTLLSELANPLNPHGIALWLGTLAGLAVLLWPRLRKTAGRPTLYWLIFGLTCFVLALGPKIQWERVRDSEPGGPYLPYYLFKSLPAAQVMHSPDRFEIPGSLALGLVLAFALAHLTTLFQGNKLRLNLTATRNLQLATLAPAFIVAVVVLLVVNEVPLNMQPLERYGFVDTLLKDKSDYYVLELPITRHNNFDYTRMYSQISYERPITGGYISRPIFDPYRDPASPFDYLADQTYAYGDPNKEIFPAAYSQNLLDLVVKLSHFDYVVVYKEDYKNQKEISQVRNLLDTRLGANSIVQEDNRTVTYKTPAEFWQKPTGPGLTLGEGWYGVEQNPSGLYRWTQPSANLYLTVEKSGPVKLKMSLLAFGGDKEARISLEGREIYRGRITPAPQPIEIIFEAKAGTNRLKLESLTPVVTPKDLGQGNDTRPLAFLVQNITLNDA